MHPGYGIDDVAVGDMQVERSADEAKGVLRKTRRLETVCSSCLRDILERFFGEYSVQRLSAFI